MNRVAIWLGHLNSFNLYDKNLVARAPSTANSSSSLAVGGRREKSRRTHCSALSAACNPAAGAARFYFKRRSPRDRSR